MIFEFEGGGPFDGDRRELPLFDRPAEIVYPHPIQDSRRRLVDSRSSEAPAGLCHVYRKSWGRKYTYVGIEDR